LSTDRLRVRLLIASCLLLFVTTCGQKGPLHLPKPQQPEPAGLQ
jgi:predicted small lipoprotein YifL